MNRVSIVTFFTKTIINSLQCERRSYKIDYPYSYFRALIKFHASSRETLLLVPYTFSSGICNGTLASSIFLFAAAAAVARACRCLFLVRSLWMNILR